MKVINLDEYSSADGEGLDKFKGLLSQVKESGVLEKASTLLKRKPKAVAPTEQPTVVSLQTTPTPNKGSSLEGKDNTLLYVGIGGGVLVLLGIIIIATRR